MSAKPCAELATFAPDTRSGLDPSRHTPGTRTALISERRANFVVLPREEADALASWIRELLAANESLARAARALEAKLAEADAPDLRTFSEKVRDGQRAARCMICGHSYAEHHRAENYRCGHRAATEPRKRCSCERYESVQSIKRETAKKAATR